MLTQDHSQREPTALATTTFLPAIPYSLYILAACFLTAVLANVPPAFAEPTAVTMKAVYHIDGASAGRFALHIAKDQLERNPNMSIAMVTYAGGVDFLLKDAIDRHGNSYEPDIRTLLSSGVRFKVCTTTLKFREIPIEEVLDGMELVPSGTYEVIRLQAEEGYVYLKP